MFIFNRYDKNLLSYDNMDTTSVNDTETESNVKQTNKISHHARIRDKLKLLKHNLSRDK